jgi:2-amino-4-hydroxy-6-hydroxymethyldihydropteridine diphosphokinase
MKRTIPSSLGVSPSMDEEYHGNGPLIVIGLGANLGDRRATIAAAIQAIDALPRTAIIARSSLWRTRPVGGPPQPDFYNAAVGVRTALAPAELMQALLDIEKNLGRVRGERNAPRTIDLDWLWNEGPAIRIADPPGPELLAPHPRLHERPFALIPLLEVAPGAADPATGRLYATVLAELGTEGVDPVET